MTAKNWRTIIAQKTTIEVIERWSKERGLSNGSGLTILVYLIIANEEEKEKLGFAPIKLQDLNQFIQALKPREGK